MPDMTNALKPEFRKTTEFNTLYEQLLKGELTQEEFETQLAAAADTWAASADLNPVIKHRS